LVTNPSYIRIKRKNQTFFIPVSPKTTFLEIKTEISKALNDATSPTDMKLFREEKEMMDAATCADHEMKCSDVLCVTFQDEALGDVMVKSES
jgi:hypothetical protein